MRADEAAWVAGLIEGEGSIGLYRHSSRKAACRVVVAVCMTDLDVLEKLQTTTGMGTLITKKISGLGKKPQWVWSVQNQPDISTLLKHIYEWLGSRRKQQADKVLNYIKERNES